MLSLHGVLADEVNIHCGHLPFSHSKEEPTELNNDPLLRSVVLQIGHACAMLMVLPIVSMCRLEAVLAPRSHRLFHGCGQLCAILPGYLGMSLRRAFYVGTLKHCSPRCHVGFGALISHRDSILEDHVYIGNYALLGEAILRKGCLLGSRSSVLSQGEHHVLDHAGRWSTPDRPQLSATEIGEHAWIGEGAIIAAPIGRGAFVAAGTVVASKVPNHIMVAGNPARFVKNLLETNPETDPSAPKPKK